MAKWQTFEIEEADAHRLGLDDRLVVVRLSKAKRVFPDDGIDDDALLAELQAAVGAAPELADRFGVAIGRLQPSEEAAAPAGSASAAAPAESNERPGGDGAACAACQEALVPGTRFCVGCGTPVCSGCGEACPKDAKFCIGCGAAR